MNLNDNPTREQLADLLRPWDDRAAHHVLWVDRAGEVRVTPVEKKRPPPEPGPDVLDHCLVRFETFLAGNRYVGPEAAADDQWLTDALDLLTREWAAAKPSGRPAMIGL
jgi:hypothetical protein